MSGFLSKEYEREIDLRGDLEADNYLANPSAGGVSAIGSGFPSCLRS